MSQKYQVTVTGLTNEELKRNVAALHAELNGGTTVTTTRPTLVSSQEDDGEEMETVPSPYAGNSSTPAPQIANAGTNGEVDVEGLPWDERIHASSKEKKNDGTWRVRRNLDKDVLATIRAELINKKNAVKYATPAMPTQQAPVVAAPAPVAQAPVAPVAAAPIPSAPMPQMGNGHTLATFSANFPLLISQLITEGKINQDYVNQLCGHFKVDQIWKLDETQKAQVFEYFVQYGFVTKVG